MDTLERIERKLKIVRAVGFAMNVLQVYLMSWLLIELISLKMHGKDAANWVIGLCFFVLLSNIYRSLEYINGGSFFPEKPKYRKLNRFGRFWIRVKVARHLIFKQKHGVVLYLNEQQVKELIENNIFGGDIKMSFFGLMEHQALQTIKFTSTAINDIDVALDKATFEAEVEDMLKK